MSEQRSRIMRAVKSRDTGPEMLIRGLVHKLGHRFRPHDGRLPGSPDLVFSRKRKALFVHGCFWHGHSCARGARVPKTNTVYWTDKVARNRKRDRRAIQELKALGWQTLVVWECELKVPDRLIRRLDKFLDSVGRPK